MSFENFRTVVSRTERPLGFQSCSPCFLVFSLFPVLFRFHFGASVCLVNPVNEWLLWCRKGWWDTCGSRWGRGCHGGYCEGEVGDPTCRNWRTSRRVTGGSWSSNLLRHYRVAHQAYTRRWPRVRATRRLRSGLLIVGWHWFCGSRMWWDGWRTSPPSDWLGYIFRNACCRVNITVLLHCWPQGNLMLSSYMYYCAYFPSPR